MHDEQYYNLINPHITLVFPLKNLGRDEFIDEVIKRSSIIKSYDFEIKAATINLNFDKRFFHEFLVLDKGNSETIKLHDQLYSEAVSAHERLDIDFIHHVGIGINKDAKICKNNIDILNQTSINIKGNVDSLDIIEISTSEIKTLEKIKLKL